MKVKMTLNLGSRDAARVQLDHAKCLEGCEVDVSDDAAQWLIATGKAKAVESPAPEAETVEAVPPNPIEAKPVEAAKGVSAKPRTKAKK